MSNELSWDAYFMSMVYLVSRRSKDQSTNLGAVIVGPDNEIRSTGYNSFVRGINDYKQERQQRPHKYYFFEHAERNAIYNASRVGIPLKNCIMYTQGIPCSDCGRAIIQAGIKEIVYHELWERENAQIWERHAKMTKEMCYEAGVNLRSVKGDLVTNLYGYKREEKFDLNTGEILE